MKKACYWLIRLIIVGLVIPVNTLLVHSQTIDTMEFLPFVQFVNYQYQGDDTHFDSEDFIVEYPMNEQGITQITMISPEDVSCHLYQLQADGLYELTTIYDYYEVEDLRDEETIIDSSLQSLVLPRYVEEGQVFYSGYQQEYRNAVLSIETDFNYLDWYYPKAIIIEQSQTEQLSNRYLYYFAPNDGLFLIEHIDQDGTKTPVYHLVSAQGYLSQ